MFATSFLARLTAWMMLLLVASAAHAADPSGRWAYRTDGGILFILNLESDAGSSARWVGSFVRPEHFQMSKAQRFTHIEPPIVERRVSGVTTAGGNLLLTVETGSADPDMMIFRQTGGDSSELAWKDVPIDPLELTRARPNEVVRQDWDFSRSYVGTREWASNAEMKAIFDADQAARQDLTAANMSKVATEDMERRARTKALLDAGALRSGDDFYHAAFVFQHGMEPGDYLLAHSLAIIAAARGRRDATWIAAATLDRYLKSIGQPQIYGTQYNWSAEKPVTQEPYNRTLVSDALRAAMGVPPIAEQEKRRAEIQASRQKAE